MYFPILNTMRNHGFEELIVNKLDDWLGTRRVAIRKFLNPLQFSIDTDIDSEKALSAFAVCTNNDIGLLQAKYRVECPQCDQPVRTCYAPKEIPMFIKCKNCDRQYRVDENCITIWFELLKPPQSPAYHHYAADFEQEISNRGKLVAFESVH